MISNKDIIAFRRTVWTYYKKEGRHYLPWRKTRDPYKILVSEMMLQQTQVLRVIPRYKEFLKAFPTARALAKAPLSDVLKVWSGLGYNRRAKYLHEAAKTIVAKHKGDVRKALASPLIGIGPYTRAAVRSFAFNELHTMLETNIRAAFIHHFFPRKKTVTDNELLPLIAAAGAGQDAREWNWALMDFGAHLKRVHANPTRRSAHYAVQSKFSGSLRQIRGEIIRLLTQGSHGDLALSQKLAFDESSMRMALSGLLKDGLVVSEKGSWRIA